MKSKAGQKLDRAKKSNSRTRLRAVLWIAVSSGVQASEDRVSLDEQEKQLRDYGEQAGWQIVDVLRVPGFSRNYNDIVKLLDDYAKKGIWAYHKLRAHWEARDFDVLAAYDDSRLARGLALYPYVVSNTLDAGASVFRLLGGWIEDSDSSSSDMLVLMGAVGATAGIKRLVNLRRAAMDKAAAQGLPTTSQMNFAYRLVRDDRGRRVRIEPDPAKKPVIDAVADLLLSGVPFAKIEVVLFEQYGFGLNGNKPYYYFMFHRWFYTASTWGHTTRYLTKPGLWAFDETVPVPDGALIWRNTHPPIFTGELAEQIKAELRRRSTGSPNPYGKRNPMKLKALSGLVRCAGCGSVLQLSSTQPNRIKYLVCKTNFRRIRKYTAGFCPAPTRIREDVLRAGITDILNTLKTLRAEQWSEYLANPHGNSEETKKQERAVALNAERKTLEEQARRLLLQTSDPRYDELQDMIQGELTRINDRLRAVRQFLQEPLLITESQAVIQHRITTLQELDMRFLWEMEEYRIHQLLSGILGTALQLVVTRDKRIFLALRDPDTTMKPGRPPKKQQDD